MALSNFTNTEREGTRLSFHLAPGTELIGPWETTAYEAVPYIIRRADGQHVQVSRLLYELASSLDPDRDLATLAALLHRRTGREVSAENVEQLLEKKLAPLGLVTTCDGPASRSARSNPLLALRFRAAIVPAEAHRRVTTALTFLFRREIVIASLLSLVGFDIWLGLAHGGGLLSGLKAVISHPALMLGLIVMTLAAGAFHEVGHATAARASGATPGVMGAGIYMVWPVFYTDVTDTYRLGRSGRLRTDLGGVYFNGLAVLGAAALYAFTGSPLLLVFIAVSHLEVAQQFLPFLRMDGYWVVSDLIGVPNLFAYLVPALARLARHRNPRTEARLARIKPWARHVIEVWVAVTVVILAFNLFVMGWLGPRVIDTTLGAAAARGRLLGTEVTQRHLVAGADDLFSLVFLGVPALGIVYMSARLVARLGRAIRRLGQKRPVSALLCALVLAGAVGYQTYAAVSGYRPVTAFRPPRASLPASAPAPRPGGAPGGAPTVARGGDPVTAETPDQSGTWTVHRSGDVTTTGTARRYGSAAHIRLAAPTVAIASTPDGRGYWLAATDGGVFAFGDASFYGSVANIRLNGPVVAIATTPDGRGYWLTATDGGVFAFGDAVFRGSLADHRLAAPVVDIAATPDGRGYWLAAADGGVFAFGHAAYLGNAVHAGAGPTTAITTTANGYELREGTNLVPYGRGP